MSASEHKILLDKIIRLIAKDKGPIKIKALDKVKTSNHSVVLKFKYTTENGNCRTVYVKKESAQLMQREHLALKHLWREVDRLYFAQVPQPLYFLPGDNLLVTSCLQGKTFYKMYFDHIYFSIFKAYRNRLYKVAYNCGRAFQEIQSRLGISYQPINFKYIMNLIKEDLEEIGFIPDEMTKRLIDTLTIVVEKNRDKHIAHAFPHGDLKAQNILVLENNKIGFLDWGYLSQLRLPVYSDIASFIVSLKLRPPLNHLRFPVEIGDRFLLGYFQDNQQDIDLTLLSFFSIKSITSMGLDMLKRHNNAPSQKIISWLIAKALKDECTKIEHFLQQA